MRSICEALPITCLPVHAYAGTPSKAPASRGRVDIAQGWLWRQLGNWVASHRRPSRPLCTPGHLWGHMSGTSRTPKCVAWHENALKWHRQTMHHVCVACVSSKGWRGRGEAWWHVTRCIDAQRDSELTNGGMACAASGHVCVGPPLPPCLWRRALCIIMWLEGVRHASSCVERECCSSVVSPACKVAAGYMHACTLWLVPATGSRHGMP